MRTRSDIGTEGKASEQAVRLLVVEDHRVVRDGLIALLSLVEDIAVVAEAGDGIEAIEQFRRHSPDITLVDLRLPRISGAEVIRALRRESEHARCIVLTAHEGDEDVYRAIEAGACAYLLKGSTDQDLIETIRLVHTGQSHFPPHIAAALARRLTKEELTPREHEVLTRIVQGMANGKIAQALGVSEATIKAHVNSILKKLGVTDRTQAATAAIQRGIVPLGPG